VIGVMGASPVTIFGLTPGFLIQKLPKTLGISSDKSLLYANEMVYWGIGAT